MKRWYLRVHDDGTIRQAVFTNEQPITHPHVGPAPGDADFVDFKRFGGHRFRWNGEQVVRKSGVTFEVSAPDVRAPGTIEVTVRGLDAPAVFMAGNLPVMVSPDDPVVRVSWETPARVTLTLRPDPYHWPLPKTIMFTE